MVWMSPKELYDDPKRFLSIPHPLHESILKLMKVLFPDFSLDGVHCLECEGEEPFEVVVKDTLQVRRCTDSGVTPMNDPRTGRLPHSSRPAKIDTRGRWLW